MPPDKSHTLSGTAVHPTCWMLLADKGGDNAQVEAIGKALTERAGWRPILKRLVIRPEWRTAKPKVYPRLDHVDLEACDPLAPPWPDILITVGRRPSSVALWIRQQSDGRTRIVLVGKPSSPIECYDLVITSAENQMPGFANVQRIALPLMRIDREAIDREARTWQARLDDLPRPLIGFLIGGPTGPLVYDRRVLDTLLAQVRSVARQGGTPYLLTSRRTPAWFAERIEQAVPTAARMVRWREGLAASDNPYRALLGTADGLIVTGDSISMMVEVAKLGRPMKILRLSSSFLGGLDRFRRRIAHAVFGEDRGNGPLGRILYRLKLVTQTRDFEGFYDYLEARGLASELSAPFSAPVQTVNDDLESIVARITALLPEPQLSRSA